MALKIRLEPVSASYGWLDQVLDDFERAMLRRDLRPATVRTYRWAVQDLFEQLRGAGLSDVSGLTRDHLERWQDTMVERRQKASTRALAANAARQFLRWAADHELVDWRLERGLTKVRVKQLDPRPIPEEDFDRLRAFLLPRRPRMGVVALRDRALFFYLLTTAARVSEALQVRRDELGDMRVVQKGGTEKTLRMPPATRAMVDDYLRGRIDSNPMVWISHRTNTPLAPLTPPGVLKIWVKLSRKLGIKPFTTHQLRHTAATELLDADVGELAVADKLGHHGLGTVHRYAQVRRRQRVRVDEVMQNLVEFPVAHTDRRSFVAFRRPR